MSPEKRGNAGLGFLAFIHCAIGPCVTQRDVVSASSSEGPGFGLILFLFDVNALYFIGL
jgi:hypothetical protein